MTLADADARRLARTEFSRPVVLVAGAGTGKTSTLVARIVAWCLGEGWRRHEAPGRIESDVAAAVLGGIAAITFTERAAAEMGDRVARALGKLRRGETPHGDPLDGLELDDRVVGVRCSALLVRLDALRVDTIHAFCRRVLAGCALDAGLHPAFTIDGEGRIVPAMIEETLARWIGDAYGDDADEDALALLEDGVGPERVAEALSTLVVSGMPARELRRDGFAPEAVSRFLQEQADAMEPLLSMIGGRLETSSKKLDKSRRAHAALRDVQRVMRSATSIEPVADLLEKDGPAHALGVLRSWRGRAKNKFSGEEREAYDGLTEAITLGAGKLSRRLEHVASLDPERHGRARRVLGPLLEALRGDMTRQGIVTFDDLLHRTAALLSSSPAACERVRAGIDQLLVDEVQDTDPVQYDIVAALALDGDADTRPGLFVVGDPKQSIYGFRSADLAAHEEFVERVEAGGGRVESLTVNFRSTPEILHEVSEVVGAVMHAEPGVQPAFEPLEAGREFGASRRRPVEYWPTGVDDDGEERSALEARRVEAEAVAESVLAEKEAGRADWGDMAILMRITSNQETYLAALREREIPYVVERDRSYFKRREIIDAISTVAAIADPNDHLSLVAFLRSPPVGLPDAALLPLWARGFPKLVTELEREGSLERLEEIVAETAREIADARGGRVLPSWPIAVTGALRDLAALRRSFRTDPVDEFVALVRKSLRQEETEACRFLGSHRLANLERFWRRLQDDLSEERRGGLHAILREHRHGVNDRFAEPESAPGDETLQAVRVMTIHRAKGLDFDQVFLVDAHHGSPRRGSAPDDVGRLGEHWETRLFGASSLRFDEIGRRRTRIEEAELVRTLYVALTRAETRLVVAGKWPARREAGNHAGLVAATRMPPADLTPVNRRVRSSGRLWFRAAAPDDGNKRRSRDRAAPVDVDAALRDADLIAADAIAAREREALRPLQSVTAAIEGDEDGGRRRANQTTLAPEAARVLGTAVHALLELRAPGAELTAGMGVADRILEESLAGEALDAARAELGNLVRAAESSMWLARLDEIGGSIVGREVPILLVEDDDVGTVTSGAIDLLYRDPDSGELVVADYKTDRPGKPLVEEQARTHGPQLRRYAEAIRVSMGLQSTPRTEVWFLTEDEIVPPPS